VALAISNVRRLAGLEHQAHHDALTGLPNRAGLHRRIAELVADNRPGDHVGVLLLDLSRFREINEALGHNAADRLLVQIGARLQDHAEREGGAAFRLGGDEFVVVQPGLGNADAAEAGALRVLISLKAPFEVAGMALEVSASLGIAVHP
jgi:diguanylate cyclase (GGDEF)-like protein